MYRIEIAPGEETALRSVEEIAVGIRNGVITPSARIYHQAARTWLPIETHPHYQAALASQAALAATAPTSGAAPASARPSSYLPSVFEKPMAAVPAAEPSAEVAVAPTIDDAEPDSTLAGLYTEPAPLSEVVSDPVTTASAGGRRRFLLAGAVVVLVAGALMSRLPTLKLSRAPSAPAEEARDEPPPPRIVAAKAPEAAVAAPPTIRHKRMEGAAVGFPLADSGAASAPTAAVSTPAAATDTTGPTSAPEPAIAPPPAGFTLPSTGLTPDSLTLPSRPLTDSGTTSIDRIRRAIIAPRRS